MKVMLVKAVLVKATLAMVVPEEMVRQAGLSDFCAQKRQGEAPKGTPVH